MKIQVVYKSKRNNKKLAEAIAQELHVKAQSIFGVTDVEADILFLGCAILGGNIPPEMEQFVEQLDASKVKQVALFTANGYGTDQYAPLKETLSAKGIAVAKEVFSCKGNAFIFINMGKPGREELQQAAEFAKRIAG